jgi:hypothetical protein
MHIVYPDRGSFNRTLKETRNDSLNFIVIATAALNLNLNLDECVRVLKNGGLLFVQGRPEYLPELGVYLDRYLNFKYWIQCQANALSPPVLCFLQKDAQGLGRQSAFDAP